MRRLGRAIDGLDEPAVEKIAEEQQEDPFQVLIATMLSAQTRDPVTAEASRRLFRVARTPRTMAKLSVKEIERLIYPVSFYRNKAVHVKETCEQIMTQFGGRVPGTMEELLTLPGVGRKTANLVLILAHRSRVEHLRRHARAQDLQPPRLGRDADARADGARLVCRGGAPVVADHQPVSGHLGPERVPSGVSALRVLRDCRSLSENRRHKGGQTMRCVPFLVALLSAPVLVISAPIRVPLESVPIRVSLIRANPRFVGICADRASRRPRPARVR